MKNPKVSIIIPHWNGIDILSECLESLLQTDYHNLEIIVVDNASTDGSPDLISLNFPQVKLLENSQNYGYAGGCNRGAEIADGDYIVFWTSGTAFMIRKFDFESAGRFDESFFAHQEEIDLCWRLHLMDKETWAIPSSVVFHKNGATLPMFSRKKQYLNHRNSLQMILSNYSLPLTLYIFPIRFTLELVALVYSFIRMDLNHAIGIIQSLLWIVSHPFSILKRRKQIKQIRIVKDKKVLPWLYWGSVVFDYYIRGKKHSANIIKE
jgi:GT2 family glycosyltransferase